jgi:hypothetical protein
VALAVAACQAGISIYFTKPVGIPVETRDQLARELIEVASSSVGSSSDSGR